MLFELHQIIQGTKGRNLFKIRFRARMSNTSFTSKPEAQREREGKGLKSLLINKLSFTKKTQSGVDLPLCLPEILPSMNPVRLRKYKLEILGMYYYH
jgi:hypothetical protein